jgi:hypothetical protein
LERLRLHDCPQADKGRPPMWDLDADVSLPGHRRFHPDGRRREGQGQVIGEAGDLRDAHLLPPHMPVGAGLFDVAGLHGELSHRWAGSMIDDARRDAEVGQSALDDAGHLLDLFRSRPPSLRAFQQIERRKSFVACPACARGPPGGRRTARRARARLFALARARRRGRRPRLPLRLGGERSQRVRFGEPFSLDSLAFDRTRGGEVTGGPARCACRDGDGGYDHAQQDRQSSPASEHPPSQRADSPTYQPSSLAGLTLRQAIVRGEGKRAHGGEERHLESDDPNPRDFPRNAQPAAAQGHRSDDHRQGDDRREPADPAP